MNTRVHRRKAGFSLVEITVALGVIAFALVGLMGLLSASLTTGRASEEDTRHASMSQQVLDMLRSGKFEEIPFAESFKKGEPAVLPPVYFDNDGAWVAPEQAEWPDEEAGIVPPEAVYKCAVIVEADLETISPLIPNQALEERVNLLRVHVVFTPLSRTVKNMVNDVTPKDPIIHATIPRY